MSKNYWLLKTEPSSYSIDDLKRDKKTSWGGIRNYQARNFIRDQMSVGDLCLVYHSNTDPGAYGIAKIVRKAYGDPTSLDRKDSHFDPKSTKQNPIWFCVAIAFVKKFKHPVLLVEMKADPKLKGMLVREQGSRLSVQPVSQMHFKYITEKLAA